MTPCYFSNAFSSLNLFFPLLLILYYLTIYFKTTILFASLLHSLPHYYPSPIPITYMQLHVCDWNIEIRDNQLFILVNRRHF